MRNPANADYQCPFLDGECNKRSQQTSGPFPVCSIFLNYREKKPICVCPVRLNEINIVEDIVNHCWPEPKPLLSDVRVISEMKLFHLGNMDMILTSVDSSGKIQKFISVELQAIDITGSYFPAYVALTNSDSLDKPPKYGFNWKNVYKRYVTQLIEKGFQHSRWDTIIVSIMQDVVLERILKIGNIVEAPIAQSNVVFLGYKFEYDKALGRYAMTLNKIMGTTHNNIVNGPLYKKSIEKSEVAAKIQTRLNELYP